MARKTRHATTTRSTHPTASRGRTPDTTVQRAVALVGHRGCGKTQLAEVLLHAAGVVRTPGRVDLGTALLDFEPDARAGRGSVEPGWAWLPWGDAVLHLIDTPGDDAAAHPAALARLGADLDVVVVSGPDGLERGAEEVLAEARSTERPLVGVLSRLDRGEVDVHGLVAAMEASSRRRTVLLQLPVVEHGRLVGLVDLLGDRLLRFDPDGGGAFSPEPVPAPRRAEVDAAREVLLEAIAVTDDALLEAYLEHLDLPADVAWDGLSRAVRDAEVLPVCLTSAALHVGAAPLLDVLARLAPDPSDRPLPETEDEAPDTVVRWVGTRRDDEGAQVTMLRVLRGTLDEHQVLRDARGDEVRLHRLYQVRGPRRAKARHTGPGAIVATWDTVPGSPGDVLTDGAPITLAPPPGRPVMAWLHAQARGPRGDEALVAALTHLRPLDPSIHWTEEPAGGVCLAGASMRQLEGWVQRIRRGFGLDLATGLPPVRYVERPAAPVRGIAGIHRKERDGLVSEYGEVWFDLAPGGPDETVRFEPLCDEDVLPTRFVGPAGEGARRALQHGPTAGYPVSGVVLRCTHGDYDALESTEDHFVTAGELAARSALQASGTELMEPWSEVALRLPVDDVGDVLADLASHRSRVVDVDIGQHEAVVKALSPDRELRTLSARLDGLTRGRGWFTVRSSHYDRLPTHLVGEAVASSPFRARRPPRVAQASGLGVG